MIESNTARSPVRVLPALHLARTARSTYRLAKVLTAFLIALPFLLTGVPWQQNVQGKGRVIGRLPIDRQQYVKAPVNGRVTKWWVAEGSVVKQGDKLLEISDNDPNYLDRLEQKEKITLAKLEASLAKLKSYEEQIKAIQQSKELAISAARERVKMAEDRVLAAERAVEAGSAKLETAQLNFKRQEALLADGLTSRRKFELTVLELKQSTAGLARLKASLSAARKEQTALEAKRSQTDLDFQAKINSAGASRDNARSELASSRSALVEIETKLARQQRQLVTAPCAGTILRLASFGAGDFIKSGESLLVLVPATEELAVELWVDGNDMPLITAGRHVRLQFEGWPAVQFAGWPSVAVGTFGGQVQLVDATDDGTGKFRVVIVPDENSPVWPKTPYLRQGVRAKGWLMLEQVTLGYEIWRQLNGFPPAVDMPKLPKKKLKK